MIQIERDRVEVNGMILQVRRATAADRDGIITLVKRVLPEFDLVYDPTTADSDLLDIEATYLRRGGMFEVIVNPNGEVVGTAGLLELDARAGKLRKMYLDPRYRGQGLGDLLLRRAIAFAERTGLERIELDTVHSMLAAQRLYEKHGFVRTSDGTVSPRCDVFMEKLLSKQP
jgi:putative acetyltransferase